MTTRRPTKDKITELKQEYDSLKVGKRSLLQMIDEVELSESVYNSNAIENSTLTLPETEKILLEMEVSKDLNLREVYEAQNLSRTMKYLHSKASTIQLNQTIMLMLHKMLMGNIADDHAGRYRKESEYVRVGTHIGSPPESIDESIKKALVQYSSDSSGYFVDKVSLFHLEFETIHPFKDGNGRIGRILINWQLVRLGYPTIIIRSKEKQNYYQSFDEYRTSKKSVKRMSRIVALALMESMHKRLAYLRGEKIISLSDYAKQLNKPAPGILNAAKRQSIPAFREKGIWKIGV
jgi:Fic family protein